MSEPISQFAIAVLAFIVLVVLERCAIYKIMGFDVRKDSPSEKEISTKFGWIKFPRTLFLAGICMVYPLPLVEDYKVVGVLIFFVPYFMCAIWDTMVAMRYIKRK